MLCYECVVSSTQSVKSVRLFERKLTYSTYRVQQYSTVTTNHDDDHDHDKHDHNNQEVN
jgi:hypothetical protein